MRFEVVGDLVGTLEARTVVYIRDISLGGALLESSVALSQGDVHRVLALGDGAAIELTVRVARQAAIHEHLYLIGVQFVELSPSATEQIKMWVAGGRGSAAESLPS
jgi:hypothetical protein